MVGRASTDPYKPEGIGKGYVTVTQPATAPVACLSPTWPFFRPSDVEATYQDSFRRACSPSARRLAQSGNSTCARQPIFWIVVSRDRSS
jgi:hypothetical protein